MAIPKVINWIKYDLRSLHVNGSNILWDSSKLISTRMLVML